MLHAVTEFCLLHLHVTPSHAGCKYFVLYLSVYLFMISDTLFRVLSKLSAHGVLVKEDKVK